MDTSLDYVKMCDCAEVQDIRIMRDRFDFVCRRLSEVDDYVRNVTDFNSVDTIWLPRQDQLQEMTLFDGDRIDVHSYFDTFNRWQMNTVPPMGCTPEKLMLMYMMHLTHDKEWKEGEWG